MTTTARLSTLLIMALFGGVVAAPPEALLSRPYDNSAFLELGSQPTPRHHGPYSGVNPIELRRGWGYELVEGRIAAVYLHYTLVNYTHYTLDSVVFYDPAALERPTAMGTPPCHPRAALRWRSSALHYVSTPPSPAALRLEGPLGVEYLRGGRLDRLPAADATTLARRFGLERLPDTDSYELLEYELEGWSVLGLSPETGIELLLLRPTVELVPRGGERAVSLALRALYAWFPQTFELTPPWPASLSGVTGHLLIGALGADGRARRMHVFVPASEPLVLVFLDRNQPTSHLSDGLRRLGDVAALLLTNRTGSR